MSLFKHQNFLFLACFFITFFKDLDFQPFLLHSFTIFHFRPTFVTFFYPPIHTSRMLPVPLTIPFGFLSTFFFLYVR